MYGGNDDRLIHFNEYFGGQLLFLQNWVISLENTKKACYAPDFVLLRVMLW